MDEYHQGTSLANPEPNAIDFLDTIKLNLFSSEIYVFTPKGDLIILPTGATVLDFAFEIHTQLWEDTASPARSHTAGASGTQNSKAAIRWEIITRRLRHLNRNGWNSAIRPRLRTISEPHCARTAVCWRPTDGIFSTNSLQKENLKNSQKLLKTIRDHYGITSDEDLYYHIAFATKYHSLRRDERYLQGKILDHKRNCSATPSPSKKDDGKTAVSDRKRRRRRRSTARRSTSCIQTWINRTIWWEPLLQSDSGRRCPGFVNSDEQVVLHKVSCSKAMRLKSSYGPRLVATRWGEIAERFTVVIAAEGIDRQGVLEDIIAALSHKLALNIRSMSINARQEVFHCEVTVQVDSTAMADRICRALKDIKGIKSAQRIS